MNGHDTSSSNLPEDVNFHVPIAQDQSFHLTFLSSYLEKLWMKHHITESDHSRCICLENPCYIPKLLKLFGISSKMDIRWFLQQTEFYLEDIGKISKMSIKSSGRTKKGSKFRLNSNDGTTLRFASSKRQSENGRI